MTVRTPALLAGLLLAASTQATPTEKPPEPDAVLAPGYGPLEFPAPAPGSYRLPPLGSAADATLLNSLGEPVNLADLYGDKLVVLSFIYTACSDVNGCPLATHVLGQVQKRLSGEPDLVDAVRLVSISFDPVNDSPPALHAYRGRFAGDGVDWQFLTAESEEALAPLLSAYGQSIKKEVDAAGNATGNIAHILRVFLIDRTAQIRNIYSVSFLHADTLASDIRTVLQTDTGLREQGDYQQGNDEQPGYTTQSHGLQARTAEAADLTRVIDNPPLGLPPVPVPADNTVTPARVQLGRKLFYDRRLSHNNTLSCAMCHVPGQGFTVNEMATAVGIEGRSVRRNAPTLYNVAYATRLFHDGRENRIEQQAWGPLLATNEMGNPSVGYVVGRLRGLPDYDGLFEAAFDGRGPGMETIGMALAGYQRILVSGNSAFDRWYFGRQETALPAAAQRGFRLFTGKAGCSQCHHIDSTHALFTDNGLHNTGIGYRAIFGTPDVNLPNQPGDLGRYEITRDPADRWKYKTPSLRNVALTPPYMHDGSLGSLREVVEFYNAGGTANSNLDPLIRPLSLDDSEIGDLAAFLHALTGDNIDRIVADALAAPVGDP